MRKQIGQISVDSGLVMIGDPCYVIHTDKPKEQLGKNWEEFCKIIGDKDVTNFSHRQQDGEMATVLYTPWGDGVYPIYATYSKNGRIKKVEIVF